MMKISKINHREQDRIMLGFPYNKELAALVKKLEGAAWSQTRKAWHFPFTITACENILKLFPDSEGCIEEFVKTADQPVNTEFYALPVPAENTIILPDLPTIQPEKEDTASLLFNTKNLVHDKITNN